MKVKFLPQDVEFEVKPGQSVLNVAHDNGVHIQSVCKGIPSCAECRVQVVEGNNNVLPPMPEELNLIGTAHFVDQRRLSCQMRCFGDVVVNLEEQVAKEHVSTKQPQGKAKKEGDSSARMGNILEDAEPAVELEVTEDERREAEAAMAEKEAREAERRKKKTKSKKPAQKKAQTKDSSKQEGQPKAKKKSRNRNRKRNRKKSSAGTGQSKPKSQE